MPASPGLRRSISLTSRAHGCMRTRPSIGRRRGNCVVLHPASIARR